MSVKVSAIQTFVSGSSHESSLNRRLPRLRVATKTVPSRCADRANDKGRSAANRVIARDAESRYAGRIYAAVAT